MAAKRSKKKIAPKKSAKRTAKKVVKKIVKKGVKKAPSKKQTPKTKKAAPKKQVVKAKAHTPPMHQAVNHPELDETPHDEVFEIFRAYDRNNSGSIDREEFARLLEALGMAISEEELAVAVDVVDSNHSGKISWTEFKDWWTSR